MEFDIEEISRQASQGSFELLERCISEEGRLSYKLRTSFIGAEPVEYVTTLVPFGHEIRNNYCTIFGTEYHVSLMKHLVLYRKYHIIDHLYRYNYNFVDWWRLLLEAPGDERLLEMMKACKPSAARCMETYIKQQDTNARLVILGLCLPDRLRDVVAYVIKLYL